MKKGVDQSFNYRHERSLLNRIHRLNNRQEVSLTNQIIFQIFLAASSNPFGAAKAVDTSAKEKEIEQKLKETTISDNPKHKKEFVKKVSDRFYSSFIEIILFLTLIQCAYLKSSITSKQTKFCKRFRSLSLSLNFYETY